MVVGFTLIGVQDDDSDGHAESRPFARRLGQLLTADQAETDRLCSALQAPSDAA